MLQSGHYYGTFWKKEMSNTCKNFQNPKIAGNWLSIGTPPPFSPKIFFNQNDSEWPEMDFKHNFENCNILSVGPPPPIVTFVTIFFFLVKASLMANSEYFQYNF